MATEELNKAAIEVHMENLIRNHKSTILGYKERLLKIRTFLKEKRLETRLNITEGDSYIRFNSKSDSAPLNSLFFVYEIGRVFPNVTWRHLVGSDQGLNYFLLKKPVSCLPAFSFSLDQQTTLLYWGEHVPFLRTTELRSIRLNNFILRVNYPNSVRISAANIIWPKSAYRLENRELERLAVNYLFNSLLPPILGETNQIWCESPFVLIGDRTISFITLHKTLCTVDEKTTCRPAGRGVINARANVIDRGLAIRRIPVDVPDECVDELTAGSSLNEVVFVKVARFRYDPTLNEQKPNVRYTIYPFKSVKLFSLEDYEGPLLTAMSIILRMRYLSSNDPFHITLTPEDCRSYLSKILGPLPSNRISKQFGLRLLENREGLYLLASALGVYTSDGSSFLYLHPALLECCLADLQGAIKKDDLIRFQKVALRYSKECVASHPSFTLFLLQELFKQELGLDLDYIKARTLREQFYYLLNICIPLSKILCRCSGVSSYG